MICPFFLLDNREDWAAYFLFCRTSLGKLSFSFHFFITLVFEGVIVEESFELAILDTERTFPSEHLQRKYQHSMLSIHHANMCNSQLCDNVLFYCYLLFLLGIGFEWALCSLMARTGSTVEAVFSVLQGASLRGSALADSRTSQKNLLLILLCLRTTLRSSGSSEDSCFFSEGFLWKIFERLLPLCVCLSHQNAEFMLRMDIFSVSPPFQFSR